MCNSDLVDDSFMRPPLWEDITSSIQNIDPENAIMLGSLATQVKLESSDDHFMEPLSSSPLLSPLEIKTELKQRLHSLNQHHPQTPSNHNHHQQHQQHSMHMNGMTDNNNSIHLNNDNNNNSNHHTYNLMCGSTTTAPNGNPNHHYDSSHMEHQANMSNYTGGTNGSGNLNQIHHSSQHSQMVAQQQHPHHMQHSNGNQAYYWQNQTSPPQVKFQC